MRSFMFGLMLVFVVGCSSPPQVRTSTAAPVASSAQKTPSPSDGLHAHLRVPQGWQVRDLTGNYIGFRSHADSAFITVWDDNGSVQWGVIYNVDDGENELRCRIGYEGEPTEETEVAAEEETKEDEA